MYKRIISNNITFLTAETIKSRTTYLESIHINYDY